MKARELELALRAELEAHGATVLRVEAGKHNRIYFEWQGKEMFCPFSATPSARNAIKASVATLRKIMGVKRRVQKNPANRARTRNAQDTNPEPELTTFTDDNGGPFAELANHEAAMKHNIDKPGIYHLTLEEYLADPCAMPSINSHGLRMIDSECPEKYWWYSPLNPDQPVVDKDAWRIGRAAHVLLLEPELFRAQIHVIAEGVDFRTNAAKAERDDAMEAGKTVIKHDQYEVVMLMRNALADHEFVGAAFQNGKPEQSLVWQDKETGVWLRCRPDFLPNAIRHIPDYKTAVSSKPEDFRKQAWNLGYHMQAALYLDGIAAVTGAEPQSFFFVVQEKTPPYVVTCIALDPISIEWGRVQNRKAIHIFAECLKTGKWPGYANEVVEVQLPFYAEGELQRQHEAGLFDTSRKEKAA